MMDKNQKRRKEAFATPTSSNRSTPASASSMVPNNKTKSAESRASSSKSVTSSTKSVNRSDSDLESALSKPELITGYDLRAHLKQIMTFTDDDDDDEDDDDDDTLYTSEDDCSIESFDDKDDRDDELRQLALENNDDGQTRTPLPTGMNNCQSLVPITEEEDGELDSEEENEMMKEIRNEIVNNVRQEMKSELELYKAKLKKLENGEEGTSDEASADPSAGNADLDNLDPKLRAAIIKMKKLDKLLTKRVRREKEVKRDRILLERRIKREIEEMHREKKDEYKEVLNNEQKFLALELPARHNEGVTVPDEFTGEEVFATQLNEDEYPGLGSKKSKKGHKTGRSSQRSNKDSERTGSGDDEMSRGDSSSVASGSVNGKKHKRKKDFIKRNKELAGDAANMIAMTDEEKKRLDELLKDVEEIPDIPKGAELDDSNPFQLAVKPGEGFYPEPDDARSLTSIDSRLKELLPPDDYRSIASSTMSHVPQNKLFTNTGVKHGIEWENRGERALFQNAEQREMNERMFAIEQELASIKNREESELETPRLGEDQLKDLIDQCVTSLSYTSMSRMTLNSESRTSFADTESVVSHDVGSTVDPTPRSPRSARQEILDNPPKLAPEVLQKLLSEAYHPLSKELSTLQEEEGEEEEKTPIPSEVWKLISMETGDESQSIDTIKSSYDSQTLTNVTDSYNDTNNETNHEPNNNVSGMVGKNHVNSRNGFRTLSRNSSASSLASVSDIGTGRETREKEPLKLPDIDPSGSLVSQGINNQRRAGSSNSSIRATPTNFNHNSFDSKSGFTDSKSDNFSTGDSRMELLSFDGEMMSPHPPNMSPHPPPSREKREGSGSKSRTGSRNHIS